MSLEILKKIIDIRTQSTVVYMLANIDDYLNLVEQNFDQADMQRSRVTHKAYAQLKEDVKAGTLLPPITLALTQEAINKLPENFSTLPKEELLTVLDRPNQMYILDGLQRTYILKDLKRAGHSFKTDQKVLLECWIDREFKNLVYRFIVLNAGRKQVNLDHQIDLLARPLAEQFERDGISFVRNREGHAHSRTSASVFDLSTLVSSFYCFLTKKYYINKETWVANQMAEENIINQDVERYYDRFKDYFSSHYIRLNELVFAQTSEEHKNWFEKETTMNAFFAAISVYANNDDNKHTRVTNALNIIFKRLENDSNALALGTFSEVSNFNSRQKNVGVATRKLIYNVWREFFIDPEATFNDLWAREVANV